MANPTISHFKIDGDSIISDPVAASPFIPGSSNVFPKFADAIKETGWELWFVDGVSAEEKAAITIGLSRNGEDRTHNGFKAQITAIWPDESTWYRDLYFPESIATIDGEDGEISGVWQDTTTNARISFLVSADCSLVKLELAVPGVVEGSMHLVAQSGDSGHDSDPALGPLVNYVRPIGRASVTAEMVFHEQDAADGRKLTLGVQGQGARGGMDHVWSAYTWSQIMTESYYLRAQVGPYAIQIMRIFSTLESGHNVYTVARLYDGGKLICAAQKAVDLAEEECVQDSLVLRKVYDDANHSGRTGAFRDHNKGYIVRFIKAGTGEHWEFQVHHDRIFWNIPTSAPGPNATGNTGFIEHLVGGHGDEAFCGVGTGGQCELS